MDYNGDNGFVDNSVWSNQWSWEQGRLNEGLKSLGRGDICRDRCCGNFPGGMILAEKSKMLYDLFNFSENNAKFYVFFM